MNYKMTTYKRIAERLLKGQPKAKPFGKLVDGRFLTGTKSLHWTKQSRLWQLFWRLKIDRKSKVCYTTDK